MSITRHFVALRKMNCILPFDEQIKAMAVRYKTTEEGMKYKLKRKFDGYHFSPNMLDIYNPFQHLECFEQEDSGRLLVPYRFANLSCSPIVSF